MKVNRIGILGPKEQHSGEEVGKAEMPVSVDKRIPN